MSLPDSSFVLSAGVAQRVQRMLAGAFGKNYVGSSPTIGIVLYVAQPVERVLVTAFGNKVSWFESHYRHISSCSPASWTRVSTSLRKQTMLVRVPLSAYFFMYPYEWKYLLMGIVERASMMCVLGTHRGFALALFQGCKILLENLQL